MFISNIFQETKCADFHRLLSVLLEDLRKCQEEGGILSQLYFKNQYHDVTFKVPVALVIGDCEGNDKLCGRFHSHNSKYLCRDCNVLFADSDNPEITCDNVTEDMLQGKTRKEVNGISHYFIDNAFHPICFGGDKEGIHGCTPPESLHVLQQGLYKYALAQFFEVMNSAQICLFDKHACAISFQCRRQSDRTFPRLSLKNGASRMSYVTAKEQTGLLLICFLTLSCPKVIDLINRVPRKIVITAAADLRKLRKSQENFRDLFSRLLLLEPWIEADYHDRAFVQSTACTAFIKDLMHVYKKTLARKKGNGLQIPKFHQLLHMPRYILKFGSPKNFNSGRCESHHISLSKRPAKTAQKRHNVFVEQVASRIFDQMLLTRALQHFPDRETSQQRMSYSPVRGTPFLLSKANGESSTTYHARRRPSKKRGRAHNMAAAAMPMQYNQEMLDIVGPKLCPFFSSGEVPCYSEFCLPDTVSSKGLIFRAHPAYNRSGQWFDWAFIKWDISASSPDASNFESIPGRFCFFADLRTISSCQLTNEVNSAGIYAVIQSFASVPAFVNEILSVGSFENGLPKYYIVDVQSIQKPAFVVQLDPQQTRQFHVVATPADWISY